MKDLIWKENFDDMNHHVLFHHIFYFYFISGSQRPFHCIQSKLNTTLGRIKGKENMRDAAINRILFPIIESIEIQILKYKIEKIHFIHEQFIFTL